MFVNLLVSYHSWFVSNVLAYWLNGSTNQDAPWQRGSPSLPHFVRWEFYRILAKKITLRCTVTEESLSAGTTTYHQFILNQWGAESKCSNTMGTCLHFILC